MSEGYGSRFDAKSERRADSVAMRKARESAVVALEALETPIRGVPSINVVNRDAALSLLASAFITIWESKYIGTRLVAACE